MRLLLIAAAALAVTAGGAVLWIAGHLPDTGPDW